MSANKNIAGWDIGGAHLKLAYVAAGQLYVRQIHCPLWRGIEELNDILKILVNELPDTIQCHHVTMTGELVDCFDDRQQGVVAIINSFLQNMQQSVKIFSKRGLLTPDDAMADYESVASMNWMASAKKVADHQRQAIFIDMGSTTTDILRIDEQGLVLQGETDFHRLVNGELVYTGVVRSCVNTLCSAVPFKGYSVPLIAENFAVTADVYRILELLPEHADLGDTMDNSPKDQLSSLKRLARMLGLDYQGFDYNEWKTVAEYLMNQQKNKIKKVITSLNHAGNADKIVGAGVGSFLLKSVAHELNMSYQDFCQTVVASDIQVPTHANDCAPAVALVFYEYHSA